MNTMELIEKVREKTGVTYIDAKAALEMNNWDVVDAVVYIEKSKNTSAENRTSAESTTETNESLFAVVAPTASQTQKRSGSKTSDGEFRTLIKKIWSFLMDNHVIASRKGKQIVSIPLLVMLIIAVTDFKVTVILMVVGLFCGVGYKIEGKNFDDDSKINETLKKASDEIHRDEE